MNGAQLKRLRLAKGLTQKELASPTYTHSYVSTIEAGRRQPSQTALEHFAGKLGVGVQELTTGRSPGLAAQIELRLHEARIALSDGRHEEADAVFVSVAKQSRQLKLPRLEAKAEEARGLVLERRGKPEDALERYQRAEEMPLRARPAASKRSATSATRSTSSSRSRPPSSSRGSTIPLRSCRCTRRSWRTTSTPACSIGR